MKIWKKIGLGALFMTAPAMVMAQTAPKAGIFTWLRNLEGLALYLVQFVMVIAFFIGVWYLYSGIMSFKANLDGDKQNNGPGKILGNIIAGVLLMGGVTALEGFTGTLFGSNIDAGAQKESRDTSRNGL